MGNREIGNLEIGQTETSNPKSEIADWTMCGLSVDDQNGYSGPRTSSRTTRSGDDCEEFGISNDRPQTKVLASCGKFRGSLYQTSNPRLKKKLASGRDSFPSAAIRTSSSDRKMIRPNIEVEMKGKDNWKRTGFRRDSHPRITNSASSMDTCRRAGSIISSPF